MKYEMKDVFEALKQEREYQDQKWGKNSHSLAEWILFMEQLLIAARNRIYDLDQQAALDNIRKVTALGVAAMEDKGIVWRT